MVEVHNERQNPLIHFSQVTLIGRFVDNFPIPVDHNAIQTDGSDINPRIEYLSVHVSSFSASVHFIAHIKNIARMVLTANMPFDEQPFHHALHFIKG